MTTNVLVVTADAVRNAVESVQLSQKFTAHRTYGDWEDLLSDNERDLRIDVVPQSMQSVLGDRKNTDYTIVVAILLRKRLKSEDRKGGRLDNAVIDQLVTDLQTVHEYFIPSQPSQTGRLTGTSLAVRWLESSIKAPYSRKLLKDPGQYSGWCEIKFGYAKAAGA